MKSKLTATSLFSILILLVLAASLTSCQNNLQVAEGGMSGTGITMGRINAFGSIIVNGIEFDTSNATFTRDNALVISQDEYSVGEIVTIQGSINANGTTGNALSVNFSDLLEGPVTKKSPLPATQLEVLGQVVNINDLTILNGFKILSDLNPADIVEVSGYSDANGEIQASSIKLKKATNVSFEIKGIVSDFNEVTQTFRINNLLVNFSGAEISLTYPLSNGLSVEITSQTIFNNILFARSIRLNEAVEFSPESDFEIEGIVTSFDSPENFSLNNIAVVTTANTVFKDGAINDLGLNVLVEVEGAVDAKGNLVAESISLLQVENLPKIEANLDAIDIQNRTFIVFGKTILFTSSTILYDESTQKQSPLAFEQLLIGDYVDVKVQVKEDGSLLALRLSREDQESGVSFEGIIQNISQVESSFSLYDIQMITDDNTIYLDSNGLSIDKNTFFSIAKDGTSFIDVEGESAGDNLVITKSILIE